MNPLRVTAHLDGPVSLHGGHLHLDGLLAWAEAQRLQLPPPGFAPLQDVEIPIAKEPGGRFHLCSSSIGSFDSHEMRYVNRKFPVAEAQAMGNSKLRRIHIGAGAQKSYRIPTHLSFAEDDKLAWYCIGDDSGIRELLQLITHLGKRRAVGRGRVARWDVETCEPWGDGFPVVRDGCAMRPLPTDWPGLVDPVIAASNLTFPYWEASRQDFYAVPP